MKYYRLMLGQGSCHAAQCLAENIVGVNFAIQQDLTNALPESWQAFNREFIPAYRAIMPDKSKVAAGLACAMLWTVCKGMQTGDRVLCPDGTGKYHVAEITGDYAYAAGQALPHRRPVRWLGSVQNVDMSDALRHSCNSIATLCKLFKHHEELETLLGDLDDDEPTILTNDETIENPIILRWKHILKSFLCKTGARPNWANAMTCMKKTGKLPPNRLRQIQAPWICLPSARINANCW